MNSWKIILAALVIFGAGVITGGLLVHHVNGRPPSHVEPPSAGPNTHPPADNHGPTPPPEVPLPQLAERLSKDFVHQLDKSLHLTPKQRDTIAKIVVAGQERNHELWTNVAPQMRKVMQDVNQQIRVELTPEQVKQFEGLMKRFRPAGHRPQPPANSPLPTNKPPMLEPTNPPPGV
ncbi:MAG: hypothetical protein ABSH11_09360 [Verrucomicrobiota bacterium]|jgi:hypothetical protein